MRTDEMGELERSTQHGGQGAAFLWALPALEGHLQRPGVCPDRLSCHSDCPGARSDCILMQVALVGLMAALLATPALGKTASAHAAGLQLRKPSPAGLPRLPPPVAAAAAALETPCRRRWSL